MSLPVLDEERERILSVFVRTRAETDKITALLSPEDEQLQSMPDASPVKWHRAHTTWFFEAFVLEPEGIAPVDARYSFLWNSYYESVGPRHARAKRGMLSRPSRSEISDYRRAVDERVQRLVTSAGSDCLVRILPILEFGIAHEEQHQELILTDLLHAFSENPLLPAYRTALSPSRPASPVPVDAPRFVAFEGGLEETGAPDTCSFAFDNERPRHKVWVEPFALADRLVTARELEAFLREGGYDKPALWLSEGFDWARAQGIASPLYTSFEDGVLSAFTLQGKHALRGDEPIAHVSYYEADAIARFLGARLPTEAEWELVAARARVTGNFADDGALRPLPSRMGPGVSQLFGDAWEWTASGYDPYPGYAVPKGALGEYNGKFMVSQKVLRGGSCLTPRRHIRASYRNFWHPSTRFQMTGIRLARDV